MKEQTRNIEVQIDEEIGKLPGKEYIYPCKTWDQTLSFWNGNIDFKTLDYEWTNPKEYQIVRTHTKETTWIQDLASPNHQ